MIKKLKRTTDNKYLQSIESDIWVDDIELALEMSYLEFENIKKIVLDSYAQEQIVEIIDFHKFKILSKEEKNILREIFT